MYDLNKAGELICVDSPICSILSPENASSLANHCIQCFRFTKAPLPCDVSKLKYVLDDQKMCSMLGCDGKTG